jgi:hypothetical protein
MQYSERKLLEVGRSDVAHCLKAVKNLYGVAVEKEVCDGFSSALHWDAPSEAEFGRLRRLAWENTHAQILMVYAEIDLSSILADTAIDNNGVMHQVRMDVAAGVQKDVICRKVHHAIAEVHGSQVAHRVMAFWHRARRDPEDVATLAEIVGLQYGQLTCLNLPQPYKLRTFY